MLCALDSMVSDTNTLEILELFAGIGGVAYALQGAASITAIDISQHAYSIYSANFQHPFLVQEIASLPDVDFEKRKHCLWWSSPPCQPYSRRGHQLDQSDSRSHGIRRVMQALEAFSPPMLAIENVLGFERSLAFQQMQSWLHRAGYWSQSLTVCPTEWGWKNRRPRFYLIASKVSGRPWSSPPRLSCSFRPLLQSIEPDGPTQHLWLPGNVIEKYASAIDLVDDSFARPTACFGSSYGKSILHAGSYLQTPWGVRRFTPREVARQLGFGDDFLLPNLSNSQPKSDRILWKYLGNSLSIHVVRYVLSHLPIENSNLMQVLCY